MSDCIFCRIIEGEIPSNTIYEDDDYKVILDNGEELPLSRRRAKGLKELIDTRKK